MSIRRTHNTQRRRARVLIQCEGDTEPNYLREFRRDPRVVSHFNVTVKEGHGGDANAVISAAIAERERQRRPEDRYDHIWCVLDVEGDTRAAVLTEAIAEARRQKFGVFLSNPCFEVWLLAHFEATSRSFSNCKATERYLKQTHWGTVSRTEYDKADPHLFRKLAERLPAALANAQLVLENNHRGGECQACNSSTEVYKLIQKLLRLLPL